MTTTTHSSKIVDIMKLKIPLAEVIGGFFVVAGLVTYVHTTYQTKSDAASAREEISAEIQELKGRFDKQNDLIVATYGDVKEIHGILRAQIDKPKK